MKLVGVLGAVLGGVMLVGCAESPRAKAPNDVFDVAQEELTHAIGTTTVTSGPLPRQTGLGLYPTDEVFGPAAAAKPAAKTWGGADADPAAESDLAKNPYSSGKDLYDPR